MGTYNNYNPAPVVNGYPTPPGTPTTPTAGNGFKPPLITAGNGNNNGYATPPLAEPPVSPPVSPIANNYISDDERSNYLNQPGDDKLDPEQQRQAVDQRKADKTFVAGKGFTTAPATPPATTPETPPAEDSKSSTLDTVSNVATVAEVGSNFVGNGKDKEEKLGPDGQPEPTEKEKAENQKKGGDAKAQAKESEKEGEKAQADSKTKGSEAEKAGNNVKASADGPKDTSVDQSAQSAKNELKTAAKDSPDLAREAQGGLNVEGEKKSAQGLEKSAAKGMEGFAKDEAVSVALDNSGKVVEKASVGTQIAATAVRASAAAMNAIPIIGQIIAAVLNGIAVVLNVVSKALKVAGKALQAAGMAKKGAALVKKSKAMKDKATAVKTSKTAINKVNKTMQKFHQKLQKQHAKSKAKGPGFTGKLKQKASDKTKELKNTPAARKAKRMKEKAQQKIQDAKDKATDLKDKAKDSPTGKKVLNSKAVTKSKEVYNKAKDSKVGQHISRNSGKYGAAVTALSVGVPLIMGMSGGDDKDESA